MRATWALATAPVLAFGIASSVPPRPVALAPRVVTTEGVRAQRIDDKTFDLRWTPVAMMPPATVEVRVAEATIVPLPAPRRIMKRAALRSPDICARHKMRKVYTTRGRWPSWRCRR